MLADEPRGGSALARSGTSTWAEDGIIVCSPPVAEGEAALRAYYAGIAAKLAARPGAYATVTDTRGVDRIPNARERKLHGELINEMSKVTGARCRISVVVVPSAVVRAALTAITWLIDQNLPIRAAATMDEALAIARCELSRNS